MIMIAKAEPRYHEPSWWKTDIVNIIEYYKAEKGIPKDRTLNENETCGLMHIIFAKIDLYEGNIGEEEYYNVMNDVEDGYFDLAPAINTGDN